MASEAIELTKGESRIRTGFNPSGRTEVSNLKALTATAIDVCEHLRGYGNPAQESNPEQERLIALAQTAYEEAAMWAVKAATYFDQGDER